MISRDEYKRRENVRRKNNYKKELKSQGKLLQKDKLSQRREKIKDLLREGLKQKDICLMLNISKPTYILGIENILKSKVSYSLAIFLL